MAVKTRSIGAKVKVNGRKGVVAGIQALEPPVSYLVKFDDQENEPKHAWVSAAEVKS